MKRFGIYSLRVPWKTLFISGLVFAIGAAAQQRFGEPIKPGFNLFSKQQDVALGQEAAAEIEKEVQLVDDKALNNYIESMGKKLAARSQDPEYPFTFKVVADPNINAFALPGGPVYINSGIIAQADNEAQVAGVVGHEIGHVVLRHSTNQASKASLFQLPAMLAQGIFNQKGGALGALGSIGLGLGLNSVLLKYSRGAEKDADIVGARMLAAAGYNPVAMATFFQKLEEAGGGRGGPEFLSSHPSPGNRVQHVTEEIQGYRNSRDYVTNTREFPKMKARAAKIQPRPKAAAAQPEQAAAQQPAAAAGDGNFRGPGYALSYPPGWRVHQNGEAATIVPDNGIVRTQGGGSGIARGILAGWFESDSNVERATSALIADLQKSNPGLKPVRGQRKRVKIDGRAGESVFLQGPSPFPDKAEFVWMISATEKDRLFYLLMIAPENEYESLRKEFEKAVRSIRF